MVIPPPRLPTLKPQSGASCAARAVFQLKPTTRKGYLAIEKKLARFAEELGIDMDHLDLLLWSRKTGEILK